MATLAQVEAAVATLQSVVEQFDAACLRPADASRFVTAFVAGERICSAGKSLAAKRVAESNVWKRAGERSAGSWLAKQAGTTISDADAALETARRMEDLAGLDKAFRTGRVSETQAKEIASAAANSPDAEGQLLELAQGDTLAGLRDACRQVKARSDNELARHRAIHRRRCFRTWTDADGVGRGDLRLLPEDLAQLRAELDAFESDVFKQARAEGRREPFDAYRADALLAMAKAAGAARRGEFATGKNGSKSPPAKLIVHIAHSALIRGWPEAGECCEIAGVGPVPVATVRAMLADAFLAAVVTDGVDVYNVAHLGRAVTAAQRTALQVRDAGVRRARMPRTGWSRNPPHGGLVQDTSDPARVPRPTVPLPPRPHHLRGLRTHGQTRRLAPPPARRHRSDRRSRPASEPALGGAGGRAYAGWSRSTRRCRMPRYLVVANQTLGGEHLAEKVRECMAAGDAQFHILVPATHPHDHLTWTEGQAQALAQQRLDEALAKFRELGASADGEVGDESALRAIGDVLRRVVRRDHPVHAAAGRVSVAKAGPAPSGGARLHPAGHPHRRHRGDCIDLGLPPVSEGRRRGTVRG